MWHQAFRIAVPDVAPGTEVWNARCGDGSSGGGAAILVCRGMGHSMTLEMCRLFVQTRSFVDEKMKLMLAKKRVFIVGEIRA